jgi:hypothetical protein
MFLVIFLNIIFVRLIAVRFLLGTQFQHSTVREWIESNFNVAVFHQNELLIKVLVLCVATTCTFFYRIRPFLMFDF